MKKLENSTLFEKVSNCYIDKNIFIKNNKNKLSVSELYCHNTFTLLLKINSAFQDLNLNEIFISQIETDKLFEILEIDKDLYLKYHLEYFYIEIPIIYDLSLKLINVIYNLNIDERYLTNIKIGKSECIPDTLKLFTSVPLKFGTIKN